MKSHPMFLRVFYFAEKGRELPPSSNPRFPSGPELKNNGLLQEEGEKGNMPFLQLQQLLPLESLRRRPWLVGSARIGRGSGKGSPVWCYWADLEILAGWREGATGTRACVGRGARTGLVL